MHTAALRQSATLHKDKWMIALFPIITLSLFFGGIVLAFIFHGVIGNALAAQTPRPKASMAKPMVSPYARFAPENFQAQPSTMTAKPLPTVSHPSSPNANHYTRGLHVRRQAPTRNTPRAIGEGSGWTVGTAPTKP